MIEGLKPNRDLNQVDVLNASQHLRRLRDQGLLEQRGKGSATYYIPTDRFVSTLPDRAPATPQPQAGERASGMTDAESRGSKPSMSAAEPIQVSAEPIQLSDLPLALQEQIHRLGKKPAPQVLRAAIVSACAWQPLSASDLSRLLNRSRVYLLNDHLSVLVADKQLELTIPEQPKHSRQAYRASDRKETQP